MPQLTITQVDSNLVQRLSIPENTAFYDALTPPFTLFGLPEGVKAPLCRLPEALYAQCNPTLQYLSRETAGGRVRFMTDASELHLVGELTEQCIFPHMPLTGSSSIDVYCEEVYCGTVRGVFAEDFTPDTHFAGTVALPGTGMRSVCLYLPLYNGIRSLSLGLAPEAQVAPGKGYRLDKPVVFYGSSITQGGCACRPSTCYTALVTRWLGVDHINLGFSGNGKGEAFMARYIASLPMSAFVLDYDHNAPNAAHLQATHYEFYRIIREAQPELPILLLSKPDFVPGILENEERRAIIEATYHRALGEGDRRIWFIDGELLLAGRERAGCTVDGCHPNDLGFMRMAETVEPVLRRMLAL